MVHGARICSRCGARVDERRAKGSLYCLSCGAPLGTTGAHKAAGSSPLVPILVGGAVLLFLGVIGTIVAVVVLANASPDPTPTASATAPPVPTVTGPNLESTASAAAATASAEKKPPPPPTLATVPTPPTAPRPTVPPIPIPPPTPTPPPPPTVARIDAGSTNPADLPPFPRARVLAELDRVQATIGTCRFPNDPTGTTTVTIGFEPDGRNDSIVRAPFGTTATGSCLSQRFRSVKAGKFSGSKVSIDRTVRLQ